MKILIDACLPKRLFKELPNILKINNLEIITVAEEFGEGVSDIEWFGQYAQQGGKFFLSNDRAIARNKAELAAYKKHELVGIFMPKNWSSLDTHQQAALIFIKWPSIMEKLEQANSGQMFLLKYNMTERQNCFEEIGV